MEFPWLKFYRAVIKWNMKTNIVDDENSSVITAYVTFYCCHNAITNLIKMSFNKTTRYDYTYCAAYSWKRNIN